MILLYKQLRHIGKLYLKVIARELPELPAEYMAEMLLLLNSQQSATTQKQLTAMMQVDKSRMVAMVEEMRRQNFLTVQANAADRREHLLTLTDKGRDAIPTIADVISRVNTLLSESSPGFTIDELGALLSGMERKLTNALKS